MTPVGMNNYIANLNLTKHETVQAPADASSDTDEAKVAAVDKNVDKKLVVLSDEGKAMLDSLSEIDKEAQLAKKGDETVGDKVESFAYGTLGMDHPDEIKKEDDESYTAGQYLKGALTIGGLLLAIV